jgi:immune inhibitor A
MKTKPNKFSHLNLIIALLVLLLSSCSRGPSNTPTTVPPTLTTVALPTNTDIPEPTTVPSPSPQPTREPISKDPIRIPVPDSAVDTAMALFAAEHPPVDYYRIATELLEASPDMLTPEVPTDPDWQVNDRADFIVNADLAGDYRPVPARLRHISENVAWWTTVKVDLSDEEIESAAELFEAEMLPVNRLLFGKEWSPGIDSDPLIHVLFVDEPRWGSSYFGYFSNSNEYPTAIFPQSNQKEMIVVSAIAVSVDSVSFAGKLGHEYQHLIQWNNDPNEDQWLNESLSELANFLSGAPPYRSAVGYTNLELFALNPDIQLTSRPEKRYGDLDQAAFMHYGAEKLFSVYLFQQFGAQFIKDLAENPDPGVISIQYELDKLPQKPRFEEVYAAWLLANLLNQPNLLEGQYGYPDQDPDFKPILPERELIRTFDGEPVSDQLPPYGARYYEIRSDVDLTGIFSGTTLARLTPADPFNGEYAWYSNRGDESEFSLTCTFDLTEVESATLNYKVWYELEEFYDYGYVEVSTDDGESWTFLETAHGTDQNPNERASGFGYTGTTLEWLEESIDFSPYAGQTIQLRFEVITDFTTNRDGLQVDDIEIPEIDYFDGAEDDSGGWEVRGFIRSSNFVPVEWIVWLLNLGVPTRVERIEVGSTQSAEFEISGFGKDFPFAAVVVSPTAPVTTMELDYELLFEHR